ncbi:hypothetical protein LCGC14_1547080 [marine sediment metagenome]|uniref:HPr kinase/phosphorylase C-terminal domain-containing protein n=1 Tax=marine sediment metagenome TaxID=412755 RepID=A0A0F9L789_9ZZZZ
MGTQHERLESHHGVFMNVAGYGVLIIGSPAIGKSSLALELLSHQHQLIADDVIDFYDTDNIICGHCPPLLSGLLHTRELGLISVTNVFGDQAWQSEYPLNYVVELTEHHDTNIDLFLERQFYTVLDKAFPRLILSISTPISLSSRLLCWLKMQENAYSADNQLQQHPFTLLGITT